MSDLRGRLHTVLKTVAAELILGKASSAQQWEQVAQHQQIILNKFADTMLDAIMPTVDEEVAMAVECATDGKAEA